MSNPWQFDVMVLTNLYGSIVSNLVCGLIGGPGLMAGANVGPRYAIFEPATRNTGTRHVGRNRYRNHQHNTAVDCGPHDDLKK